MLDTITAASLTAKAGFFLSEHDKLVDSEEDSLSYQKTVPSLLEVVVEHILSL